MQQVLFRARHRGASRTEEHLSSLSTCLCGYDSRQTQQERNPGHRPSANRWPGPGALGRASEPRPRRLREAHSAVEGTGRPTVTEGAREPTGREVAGCLGQAKEGGQL